MIVNGNLLAQVSHCVVGDLHRVPVEQLAQRVTLGDGAVQDPQELTNISRDTGIPLTLCTIIINMMISYSTDRLTLTEIISRPQVDNKEVPYSLHIFSSL